MKTRAQAERAYGAHLNAEPVDNVVVWRNPHFPKELPPDVHGPIIGEVGARSKLGLFLTPKETGYQLFAVKEYAQTRSRVTEARKHHFEDDEGNHYEAIDLKGMGHVVTGQWRKGLFVAPISYDHGWTDLRHLREDRDWAEKLHEKGLRVVRHIAHIKLNEIIHNGERITVEEAGKKGIPIKDREPAIAVRAFGVRTRTYQLNQDGPALNTFNPIPKNEMQQMLEDARSHVAKELRKKPEHFTMEDYLNWFAQTLGKNVGKLHALGYVHDNLGHNVTLDARLVDFNTLRAHGGRMGNETLRCDILLLTLARAYLTIQDKELHTEPAGQLYERLRQKFKAAYDKENPPTQEN